MEQNKNIENGSDVSTSSCCICGEIKPVSLFYKHAKTKDGCSSRCRECQKAYARQHRIDNKDYYLRKNREYSRTEKYKQKKKDYYQSEVGRESQRKAKVVYKSKNVTKVAASAKLNGAIRAGDILRPEICGECGKPSKVIHGHHDDYLLPLEVRWMCPMCHMAWHGKNGPGLNGD